MAYDLDIQHVPSGEVRRYTITENEPHARRDFVFDPNDANEDDRCGWLVWQWHEHNASCDCVRVDYFNKGTGQPEDVETPCGDETYSVRITFAGEIVYDEIADREHPFPKGVRTLDGGDSS